ncbi:MAG: 2-amino-4-hydroxy-6-hydroxymethyldihydropteridine diphosphokinase [Planctomycetota bacterium]
MARCLIGLGSNLGDRAANLAAAVAELRHMAGVEVTAVSHWSASAPAGGPRGQQEFLNGALVVETAQPPRALLARLQTIEGALGRRRGLRWAPRAIDLDLLLYDEVEGAWGDLVLPHPRLAWRRFVLEPAAEIATLWRHPSTGWTIARLLAHLNETPPLAALAGVDPSAKRELVSQVAAETGARWIAEPVVEASREQLNVGASAQPGEATGSVAFLLECAQRRTEVLRNADVRDGAAWLSEFWLGESWAMATARLEANVFPEFERRWWELVSDLPRPRLVVLLERSAGEGVEQAAEASRARFHEALLSATRGANVGPVLRQNAPGIGSLAEELPAALVSMQ